MSRWLLSLVIVPLWLVASSSQAQAKLAVWGAGTTVNKENSTSFIEVTHRYNGVNVCTFRCEPNSGCAAPAGCTPADGVYSRLIYDETREKLVQCNGEQDVVGPCERADGILTATTHLRMGRLKIIPKAAPGYSGLSLNTSGAGVRLQFVESTEDYWNVGYYSGFGVNPQFTARPAGKYKVVASDLSAHCKPIQNDPELSLTIPEGEDVELTILFRATECTLTVNRTLSEGSPGGVVQTTPAGLTCGASLTSPCTGKFAFGTELTLEPDPDGNVGYSFKVGDGCVPYGQPCKHEIRSDRSFTVNFSNSPPVVVDGGQDAGTQPEDAGTQPEDAGTQPEDAGNEPGSDGDEGESDAGIAPDEGSNPDDGAAGQGDDGPPADGADDSDNDNDNGGSNESGGCTLQPGQASSVGCVLGALLVGLLIARRRRVR